MPHLHGKIQPYTVYGILCIILFFFFQCEQKQMNVFFVNTFRVDNKTARRKDAYLFGVNAK